jgi:hypothetical protein
VGLGLLVVALLGAWLAGVCASLLREGRSPAPLAPEQALTLVAAVAGTAAALWLALGLLAALLGHLPGRFGALAGATADRFAPACTRRVAAVLVGASLGGALAPGTAAGDTAGAPVAPATHTASVAPAAAWSATGLDRPAAVAAPGWRPSGWSVTGDRGVGLAGTPSPGWVPERPRVRPQPAVELLSVTPTSDDGGRVVVHRGDTLWGIARAHLGPDASDEEVAAAWPRWHAANHDVIGDDPDVLQPGQVLRTPEGPAAPGAASRSAATGLAGSTGGTR